MAAAGAALGGEERDSRQKEHVGGGEDATRRRRAVLRVGVGRNGRGGGKCSAAPRCAQYYV